MDMVQSYYYSKGQQHLSDDEIPPEGWFRVDVRLMGVRGGQKPYDDFENWIKKHVIGDFKYRLTYYDKQYFLEFYFNIEQDASNFR